MIKNKILPPFAIFLNSWKILPVKTLYKQIFSGKLITAVQRRDSITHCLTLKPRGSNRPRLQIDNPMVMILKTSLIKAH